jgi:predicted MPP superfamily phosphohydrolase
LTPDVALAGLALSILVGVPAHAWRTRSRAYAIFGLVVLCLALPGALLVHARLRELFAPAPRLALDGLFLWGMASAGVHLLSLANARLRTAPFRWAVSVAGQTFLAAGFLSGVYLLALLPLRGVLALLGFETPLSALRWLDVLPLAVAGISVLTSSRARPELVRVSLDARAPEAFERAPVERSRRHRGVSERRGLRIVQIADPHLGPWQPVAKLRRTLEGVLESQPDLVLVTGDLLTMEGMGTPGALARALEPLAKFEGRTFACLGNHDHEAPDEVRGALESVGVRLLVDEEACVDTEVARVQLVGSDWITREREAHQASLLARFPRRPDHLRLLLLHDPSAFAHVPDGAADLVLSGHTHGGQIGLVSLGLDWTVLSGTRWPDHGFFALGRNRLYVHRGTGFYGFPLRIGVPGEDSVLDVDLGSRRGD